MDPGTNRHMFAKTLQEKLMSRIKRCHYQYSTLIVTPIVVDLLCRLCQSAVQDSLLHCGAVRSLLI